MYDARLNCERATETTTERDLRVEIASLEARLKHIEAAYRELTSAIRRLAEEGQ